MPTSSATQSPPSVSSTESYPVPKGATLWTTVPTCSAIILFLILNQISFQIATGPALVLLVRRWGGSAFYIGTVSALTYWLQLLQLFTAPSVEYIGYRRVMLSGWTARNVVLLFVTALPFLTGHCSHFWLLQGIFWGMFLYNFLRGLVASSWLPWIRVLVPEDWRGRYISAEQTTVYLSIALANFACGGVLGRRPSDLRFGVAFALALGCGWGSLYYLRRMHEPPPLEGTPPHRSVLAWMAGFARQVWRSRPIRRIVQLNMLIHFAIAAWQTFIIVYLRDQLHVSDRLIMYVSGVGTLGALVSGRLWGPLADRFGSRPVLALSTRLIGIDFLCWLAMSLGVLPPASWLMTVLYMAFIAGYIGFIIGNNRYVMHYAPGDATVPAMTLFNVVQGIGVGLAPLLWGIFLDTFLNLDVQRGRVHVTRFTLYFLLSLIILVISKLLVRRLPEDREMTTGAVLACVLKAAPGRIRAAATRLARR